MEKRGTSLDPKNKNNLIKKNFTNRILSINVNINKLNNQSIDFKKPFCCSLKNINCENNNCKIYKKKTMQIPWNSLRTSYENDIKNKIEKVKEDFNIQLKDIEIKTKYMFSKLEKQKVESSPRYKEMTYKYNKKLNELKKENNELKKKLKINLFNNSNIKYISPIKITKKSKPLTIMTNQNKKQYIIKQEVRSPIFTIASNLNFEPTNPINNSFSTKDSNPRNSLNDIINLDSYINVIFMDASNNKINIKCEPNQPLKNLVTSYREKTGDKDLNKKFKLNGRILNLNNLVGEEGIIDQSLVVISL